MYRSVPNLTVKTALKSVDFLLKLQTKISWLLFVAHGVLMLENLRIRIGPYFDVRYSNITTISGH